MPQRPHPLLKVCGLRHPQNIEAVASMEVDYLGFIFYPGSSRYVGKHLPASWLKQASFAAQKVGVFVNASAEDMLKAVEHYGLDLLQLHGQEPPARCQHLNERGVSVIKAFSVGESFEFAQLEAYQPFCEAFLFDAKGKLPGGNGHAFDWKLLRAYPLQHPFFLSGGLGLDNLEQVSALAELPLQAVDVNSKFEEAPGLKAIDRLHTLTTTLSTLRHELNQR